jgi:ABC-type uncharacterized transport system YnjBCD substrate-binding protein
MLKITIRQVGLLSLVLILSSAADTADAYAQTVDAEAARKEARIIVYGTTIANVMAPIHANFEKRYGVKVEYWRA